MRNIGNDWNKLIFYFLNDENESEKIVMIGKNGKQLTRFGDDWRKLKKN